MLTGKSCRTAARRIRSRPGSLGSRPASFVIMIVELKRDPDDLSPGLRSERGRDRAIDAARHGNDDALGA